MKQFYRECRALVRIANDVKCSIQFHEQNFTKICQCIQIEVMANFYALCSTPICKERMVKVYNGKSCLHMLLPHCGELSNSFIMIKSVFLHFLQRRMFSYVWLQMTFLCSKLRNITFLCWMILPIVEPINHRKKWN